MATLKTADLKAKYELYARRAEQIKALMDDPGLLEDLLGTSGSAVEKGVKESRSRKSDDPLGPYKVKLTEAVNSLTSESNKMDSRALFTALTRIGFHFRNENKSPKGLGKILKALYSDGRIDRTPDRAYFPMSSGRNSSQLPLTPIQPSESVKPPAKTNRQKRKRFRPNRPDTPEMREELRKHFSHGIISALTYFANRPATSDQLYDHLARAGFDFKGATKPRVSFGLFLRNAQQRGEIRLVDPIVKTYSL